VVVRTLVAVETPQMSTPSGFVASNIGENTLTLTWNPASSSETPRYIITRDGVASPLATIEDPVGITFLTVIELAHDTDYTFRLKSVDRAGVNLDSNSVSVSLKTAAHVYVGTMLPLTSLTADSVTDTAVNLVWEAYSDSQHPPVIEIFKDGISIAKFDLAPETTTYAVSGLIPGTAYAFSAQITDKSDVRAGSTMSNVNVKTIYWSYDFELATNHYQKDFSVDALFTHGSITIDDFYSNTAVVYEMYYLGPSAAPLGTPLLVPKEGIDVFAAPNPGGTYWFDPDSYLNFSAWYIGNTKYRLIKKLGIQNN